jgi:hypothetical protein
MTEEGDIKRDSLEALERVGAFAFRVQSGMVKVRGGWMHLSPPGTADILVIVPPLGRILGLEVKTAKGTEREAQLAWADGVRALGGAVRTVRSPQEAVRAYFEVLPAALVGGGKTGT